MRGRYVTARLLQVVPTVIGIVIIGFLLVHLAPGDPILALAGEHGDAEYYAFMRRRFGLDEPLWRQLITYVSRVAQGDFSFSYVHGRSAMSVILERAPATVLLTGTALLLAVSASIPFSALAAQRPHGAPDVGISAGAIVLYSTPVFLIGQIVVLVFAVSFAWFPVQGMTSAGGGSALDVLRHLALPTLALASQEFAVLVRITRGGLIQELTRDHIRTARAKGVPQTAVILRHALPRAMIPTVGVIGVRAGQLIAGALVVETVFGWPGIGRLLHASLHARDMPILLGLFFVISFSVVLFNLVADLVQAAIDPRVRAG